MKLPLAVIFLTGMLFAGSRQLVLLGEPRELLHLLHVELTGDAEFTLLAREEIDLILREHQLITHDPAQLLQFFPHADLLAVLSADRARKSGRLLIFNAKNGFRLADQSVPTGDLSAVSGNMADVIRASARKTPLLKPHYVAINLVRQVAIDSRQSNALQNWLRLFSSELLQHPDLQLLERENLGRVLSERELTGQRFALTPSTRLLTFEFETVDTIAAIKVTLYCHDLDGRELRRLMHPDVLADPQVAIRQLIKELYAVLSETQVPPVADATQQEAESFYASSRKTGNLQEALTKIEAAIALSPENETYRYAEILALSEISSFANSKARLEQARRTFAVIRRFQKDFPQCRQPFFPDRLLIRWWSLASHFEYLINEYTVRCRDDEVSRLQKEQQELAEFYAQVRPAVQQDLRRLPQYAFDFSDGMNDTGECTRFQRYFQRLFTEYNFYVNRKEWLEEHFTVFLQYLRALDREYRRNSATAGKIVIMEPAWHVLLREAEDRQAFNEFFSKDASFLAFLDSSSLPYCKRLAGELRLVLKLLQNRPYREKVRQIYLEYYAGLASDNADCFTDLKSWRQRLTGSPFSLLNSKCYQLPGNYAWVCLEEFLGNGQPDGALERLDNSLYGTGEDKQIQSLLEVADELSTLGGDSLLQYRIANAFRDLSILLWERKQPALPEPLQFLKLTGAQEQLLCSLNRNFDFHHGRFDEALAFAKPLLCLASCRDGDGVLLLLGGPGKQLQALLARINADGVMSMLPEVIEARQPFWFGDIGGYAKTVFLCDERYILAIISGQGFLINRQQETQITRFTALHDVGNSQVLLENRVYVLGDKSLHSINLEGEQRRLHFSQHRLNGQLALEQGGKTQNLVAAKNGELFFLVEFPVQGKSRFREEIWRFDPRQEIFERALELPAGKRHALQQGEFLPQLLSLDRRTCIIFQIESPQGDLHELARLPDKDKFRLARFHGNWGDGDGPRPFPFLLRDGYLWTGGLNSACVNLDKPQESPLLWLPVTEKVFPLGKDVFFIRHNYWFRVREKEF